MSELSANPLVTVYITTYNRVELLQRALESVINQTYKNIEVFVVDDNSTDATPELMSEYTQTHSFITYFRNERKMACHSRNRAIKEARGDFITGLDDDDEFTAERIETFLDAYDAKYSFLCANVIIKTGKKTVLNDDALMEIDKPAILYENYAQNQVFVATERIRQLGGFDVSLSACQDYDMWIRLVLKFGPAPRIPVATYIVYEDAGIFRITASPKAFKGYLNVYRKYKPLMTKEQRVNRLVYVRRVQGKTVSSKSLFFLKYLGVAKTMKFVVREKSTRAYMAVNFLRAFPKGARRLIESLGRSRTSRDYALIDRVSHEVSLPAETNHESSFPCFMISFYEAGCRLYRL